MGIVGHGHLLYTDRAFDQDAQERMGNQIENALVELITNADDSYTRMENIGQVIGGKITIEVERHRKGPSVIRVKDRAEGMTTAEMEKKLVEMGGETSGRDQGIQVRGSRGRGAKDVVAFGPVEWESVKGGQYHRFRLEPPTEYWIEGEPKVTDELGRRLGMRKGETGTVVTMTVDSKRFSVPQHETTLKKCLSHHFRLRIIMTDEKRRVTLVNLNQPGHTGDLLDYRYPEEYYTNQPMVKEDFVIPGYPASEAHLRIWRHSEPFNESHLSPDRQGGLLVQAVATSTPLRCSPMTAISMQEGCLGRWMCHTSAC